MSTVGMNVDKIEFDAAQALLDLQSNIRERKHEQYGENPLSDANRRESAETANLFLSCVISSNVGAPPNKAMLVPNLGTIAPLYAVDKNATITPVASSSSTQTPKRDALVQELPYDSGVDAYPGQESASKRSRIFKSQPIRNFTVTAGPRPEIATTPIGNSAYSPKVANIIETKVKTRDAQTQTEDQYQLPIKESMEMTITKLSEKIKSLQKQLKANAHSTAQLMKTIENDLSDNDNNFEDNDESYKANSTEMAIDDSISFDSDDTYTEVETPEKVNKKPKAGYNKGNNSAKAFSNRNVTANANDMVPIGAGTAMIPSRIFRHINWNSYTSATRKLLAAVFSRRVLATHSLTGKPSPAFPNKPAKKKLDPALVNDIVQTVVEQCNVPENVVRTSITTKCADESKMFRIRQQNKKKRKHKVNRENIPPDSDSDEC